MSVALFTHPAVLRHDTGPEHPECADRVRAVVQARQGIACTRVAYTLLKMRTFSDPARALSRKKYHAGGHHAQ